MTKLEEEVSDVKLINKTLILKMIKFFMITIISFVVLLLLAWAIPDKMVKYNVEYSLNFVGESWTPTFTFEDSASLDDYTDRHCLGYAIKEGSNENYNLFQSVMDVKNYARYWHGYLVFLRPMLCFFNYLQIRYINMFLFMILISAVFSKVKDRLGWGIAVSFIIALCMTNILIIPWSLQFSPVYYIMLIFMIVILSFYQGQDDKSEFWTLAFLFVGMLTNFLDFLSAPLLTVGVPLCIITLLELKVNREQGNKKILLKDTVFMVSWGLGYALCWISKWVIASLVLQKNILLDAAKQAELRSVGGEETVIDAITKNLGSLEMPYFQNIVEKWYGLSLVILIVAILIGAVILFHKKNLKSTLPFVLLAVMPYIWMCVFKQHSSMHWIFVYRIQMISVFALLSIYIHIFDWDRFKQPVLRLMMRKKNVSEEI